MIGFSQTQEGRKLKWTCGTRLELEVLFWLYGFQLIETNINSYMSKYICVYKCMWYYVYIHTIALP